MEVTFETFRNNNAGDSNYRPVAVSLNFYLLILQNVTFHAKWGAFLVRKRNGTLFFFNANT